MLWANRTKTVNKFTDDECNGALKDEYFVIVILLAGKEQAFYVERISDALKGARTNSIDCIRILLTEEILIWKRSELPVGKKMERLLLSPLKRLADVAASQFYNSCGIARMDLFSIILLCSTGF